MALSGCRGGAIGAAVTLGVLGISVIDLIFGLTPVRPAEVIVILSNGLLSGTAMGPPSVYSSDYMQGNRMRE